MEKLLECIRKNEYEEKYIEYYECIKDIIDNENVKGLCNFKQHLNTSRLEHSIYVSYYSYLVAKKFNLDFKSAARGGLLHDLYLYDWRVEKQPEGNHAVAHPIVALRNAKKIANLNEIESDAIVKHMWPVTFAPPVYKESMIVSCADKYSATVEVTTRIGENIASCAQFVSLVFLGMFVGGVFAK